MHRRKVACPFLAIIFTQLRTAANLFLQLSDVRFGTHYGGSHRKESRICGGRFVDLWSAINMRSR